MKKPKNKKQNKMPDLTTLTTQELMTIVVDYVEEDGQAAFAELQYREIKTGDADCDEGSYKTRGAYVLIVRPLYREVGEVFNLLVCYRFINLSDLCRLLFV